MLRIASPLPAAIEELATAVVDAAFEVHQELGPGLAESMYSAAMTIELESRSIPFKREYEILMQYKNRPLGLHRLDLVVANALVVELKAVERLHPAHHAQLVSYLRASKLKLGLLINFNAAVIKGQIRRVIL